MFKESKTLSTAEIIVNDKKLGEVNMDVVKNGTTHVKVDFELLTAYSKIFTVDDSPVCLEYQEDKDKLLSDLSLTLGAIQSLIAFVEAKIPQLKSKPDNDISVPRLFTDEPKEVLPPEESC